MLRFHYVVLPKKKHGSSTGPEGKAGVVPPFSAGRLLDYISHGDGRWGNQQTLRLVYFIQCLVECDYDMMSVQVLPV